jgi:hypothetical protein
MRSFTLTLLVLLQGSLTVSALADELRPAYLSIREKNSDEFSVLWKIPALGERRLGLYPQLPDACVPKSEPVCLIANATYRERWTAVCSGGLRGRAITIDGLRSTATDALARIEYRDGSVEIARLTPEKPRFVVAGVQSGWEVAWTYFLLGVDHILSGYDHLLFIFALVLLINDFWMLTKTITAFTLAHSITLAGASLGYFSLPQHPVEATIAPGRAAAVRKLSLGRSVRLWPSAWLWLCGRPERDGASADGRSRRSPDIQYRRGSRPAPLRRFRLDRLPGGPQLCRCLRGTGAAHGSLRHRRRLDALVRGPDQQFRGVSVPMTRRQSSTR